MYRSAQSMINYEINAFDGNLGHCKDFLFDDQFWTVRYLVVNTGNWLTGRKVLISPASIERADLANNTFDVNLTREQIENAPPLDEDAPVSRQYEISWVAHYGLSPYWLGPLAWGETDYPSGLLAKERRVDVADDPDENQDKNLRSVNEVIGYRIQGSDRELGQVEDFILDDESWSVRYLVVNTGNWLKGRKVLLSHLWIEFVSWAERSVSVNLTAEQIENSPEFDPTAPVNRAYEERLYDYYGRPRYWE